MKTYLVTGGAGFIGSNFVLYMLKKYSNIKIVNIDALTYAGNMENLKEIENNKNHIFYPINICDKVKTAQLFEKYDFDYIINFAAESHVDRSIENPDIFAETNILGTLNLLNLAKKQWSTGNDAYKPGVRFLQVGTDEVYGDLPLDQPDLFFTETTPLNPHSPYSVSKTSADLFTKAYFDTYKLPINITRCSNNYGPYQFPEKLIPLMINNALNKKSLPVYGDGMQVRDWLYVEDHCKAIDMVVRDGKVGEIYNIGGHNEFPNIEIVKSIISYVNENVDAGINETLIKYVEDRKGHDQRYGIDPTKIKKDLGWEPETMFKDGIKLTIQWYVNNKKWMEDVTTGHYQEYYNKMYKNR